MKKVFIDTDIIINYTKGFGDNLKGLFDLQVKKEIELYTNPIVIAEFFTDNALLIDKNLRLALKLFESFRALDITKSIGLLGGELMRTKTVLFIADALIAATCLHYNLVLATNNKKDFLKIKELSFYDLDKSEIEDFKNIKKVHKTLKEVRKKLF
jgi:predicted nucleic acid-binding protein